MPLHDPLSRYLSIVARRNYKSIIWSEITLGGNAAPLQRREQQLPAVTYSRRFSRTKL